MICNEEEADVRQEYGDITSNPPPGTNVKLENEGDLNLWNVTMDGPDESVYKVDIHPHLFKPNLS